MNKMKKNNVGCVGPLRNPRGGPLYGGLNHFRTKNENKLVLTLNQKVNLGWPTKPPSNSTMGVRPTKFYRMGTPYRGSQ